MHLSSSSDLLQNYIDMRFGDETAIDNINKQYLIKKSSTYRVFQTTLGEGVIIKIVCFIEI